MADILTLADARAALRKPPSDTADDNDLLATYIPAVTLIVEDLAGPIVPGTGRTWVASGGGTSVLLPTSATAITSVVEGGTTLTAGVDYIVDLQSGVITRGTTRAAVAFFPGHRNITVTYDVGATTIPANVKLAARMILRHLWQRDQTGPRASLGQPDNDLANTPSGYAIPKAAYELLGPYQPMPGFA